MHALLAILITTATLDGGASDAGTGSPATPPLRLAELQQSIVASGVDGWLLTDAGGQDELALHILGLSDQRDRSRRWWYLVPVKGAPKKLVHASEPDTLDSLPGESRRYTSWRERDRELARLLTGLRKVAMNYSPRAELADLSRVDAGTVELVHALGPTVVSAGDIAARYDSVLTPAQLEGQRKAAMVLGEIIEAALANAAEHARAGQPLTERDLADRIGAQIAARGMVSDHAPRVWAGTHTADPQANAPEGASAPLSTGSLVLIQAWAKLSGEDAAYADLTRMGYLGAEVPFAQARTFAAVVKAREAALALLRMRSARGSDVTGAEMDDVVRASLRADGLEAAFIHRTGHSLGREVRAGGANLDDYETRDTRKLLVGSCFTIAPDASLPGKYGCRSGIDVCILPPAPGEKMPNIAIPGPTPQSELPALMK